MRRDDHIQTCFTYWQSLNSGKVPERKLLDPAGIARLLPNVTIVELEDHSGRLRYRLSGSEVDRFSGGPITGLYVDQFLCGGSAEAVKTLISAYRKALSGECPVEGEYGWQTVSGLSVKIPFGIFPFSVDGIIRQFLMVEDYTPVPDFEVIKPWVRQMGCEGALRSPDLSLVSASR